MPIESYIAHLLGSPDDNSCVKAGAVLEVGHGQVTQLLNNETYNGADLFAKGTPGLVLRGGTPSVDDSVMNKPYSDLQANDLVVYQWSGKHHQTVRGICLVALLYTDILGHSLPINFRLYNPNDDVYKHQLLQQMVRQVIQWGRELARFTADSWCAALENLTFLRNQEMSFQVGLKSNCTINTQPDDYERVGHIEQLFRAVKQVCHVETFFVRKAQAVNNHIYSTLRAFQRLTAWSKDQFIDSIYALRKTIYIKVQRTFIQSIVA